MILTSINWFHNLPFFSIFLAMFLAIITPLIKSGKVASKLNAIGLFIIIIFSSILLYYTTKYNESFTFMMGHFPAPWGNELKAGPFEALMALMVSVVMFLTLRGGKINIFEDIVEEKQKYYFLVLNLLLGAMIALIYTNDVFTAYVFIEINTLASCALIVIKQKGEAIASTIHYLIVSSVGSGLFLIGLSVLYDLTGHLLMPNIQEQIILLNQTGEYQFSFMVMITLIIVGISIKSALYPFSSMLPGAYNASTPSAAAILSGLVLKSYIIVVIKFIYQVFSIEVVRDLNLSLILFLFGIAGIIMGSLSALKETRIKRMLAYSSVGQIGYIFMGLGLGVELGIVAAVFQIISHALSKSLLFVSSGGLIKVSNNKDDNFDLRGAARKSPLSGIGYTVGALSIIGVPLFSGFVSKLYLAEASLQAGNRQFIVLIVLGISMILNALYFIPSIISIWINAKDETITKVRFSNSYYFSILCFVGLIIYLGLNYVPIINIIESGLSLLS